MATVHLDPEQMSLIVRALDEYLKVLEEYEEDQGCHIEEAARIAALAEQLRRLAG